MKTDIRRSWWHRLLHDERGAIGSLDGVGEGGGEIAPIETPSHTVLTDASLIQPPGAEKPISFKDYASGFVSKADHTKLQGDLENRTSAETLIQQARQYEARQQALRAQQARQTQQPAAIDPRTGLRDQAFLTGKTADDIFAQLEASGISRDQWGTAVNRVLTDGASKIKDLESRLGTFETTRSTDQQSTRMDTLATDALKSAGIDLSHEAYAPIADTMRNHAQNHYYSYEPSSGQTREQYDAEWPALYATQLESEQKALRILDQIRAVEVRAKKIPKRGGSVTPGGAKAPRWVSAKDRAAAHFAGVHAATT